MTMKSLSNYENFKNDLVCLKDSVDPKTILEDLGIEIYKETNKEIRSSCFIHGGDNKTALRFNKEKNTWVCFTKQCHELYGNDIIGLVKGVKGCSFLEAVDYLKSFGSGNYSDNYYKLKRKKEIETFIDFNMEEKPVHECVNEEFLRSHIKYRSDFFNKQGFSNDTLDKFEIAGGWVDGKGIKREIIPVRNDIGNLYGYNLRDIVNSDNHDDKYTTTDGFSKGSCLYNLHNIKDMCKDKPLIVVEGFKSVWRLYEYGIKNVVATMGAGIVEEQRFLLFLYALNGIVTFFDNDMAGINATKKTFESLEKKLEVKPVFIQEVDELGSGLDPADLSKEQVYNYLRNYF